MNLISKTLAAGAAALTLAMAFAPAAEARPRHGWHGGHGWIGGGPGWHGRHGWHGRPGWHGRHGWHGRRHWGPVAAVGIYGAGCYVVRQRVWSDEAGRFVRVRRTVCE